MISSRCLSTHATLLTFDNLSNPKLLAVYTFKAFNPNGVKTSPLLNNNRDLANSPP